MRRANYNILDYGIVWRNGANFSLQTRTQFVKISNKKVITENQFEKHKN